MTMTSEIPPRARRRAKDELERRGYTGNTSACAEKRKSKWAGFKTNWKYLRVRGEE